MTYQELQDFIQEGLVQGVIDIERSIVLSEKIDKVFLNEQGKIKSTRKTTDSVTGVAAGGLAATSAVGATKHLINKANKVPEIQKTFGKLKLSKPHAIAKVATGAVVGAGAWGIYRSARAIFDKCSRQCGMFKINTPKRQECLKKCKEELLRKKNELMKKGK